MCLVGCSQGGDWTKAREVYCDAVGTQHHLIEGRFGSTLAVAAAVSKHESFEDVATAVRRFSTCELIYAELEGTRLAMRAFEDGARGLIEGRAGDGFAELDLRFDPLTARLAIMEACRAGDRAQTEKLVGALRETSLQRIQQSIDACNR